MKPSFYSLFKRGRYLSASDDEDDPDVARKRREERERFAVAVLAFCLRHDEGFRKHFWKQICRVSDDPDQMPLINDIDIELHEWADLSLISNVGKDRYRWVIEAKAGAGLQDWQNPDKPAVFMKPGYGYGAYFAAAEAKLGTKMRYIVLGANDRLGINGQKPLGISVQERSWADLLKGIQRTGIVKDLIDTLAKLRIKEFYMENAKDIVVTGGIQDAVKALTVLDAICEYLGVQPHKRGIQPDSLEDGGGRFGYYINQPSKKASEKHRELQKATGGTSGWVIAWFGYEYNTDGKAKKGVIFYLNAKEKRDSLKAILISKGFEAAPEKDGEAYCVHVSSPLSQSKHDFEWFQSIVDGAIGFSP